MRDPKNISRDPALTVIIMPREPAAALALVNMLNSRAAKSLNKPFQLISHFTDAASSIWGQPQFGDSFHSGISSIRGHPPFRVILHLGTASIRGYPLFRDILYLR